jgi:ATP-dependent DNA ligase
MEYNKFNYIYPTRPDNPAPPTDIQRYDNGMMLGQPKSNGSNCVIFTNGKDIHVMNRHNELLTRFELTTKEVIDNLYKCEHGKWMVLNGEYMNKAKNDENGKLFNHKLVLFDILVFNSVHLLGKTYQERVNLLDELYGQKECDKSYYHGVSDNIFKVKTYYKDFSDVYKELSKIDMIEGLVLKRKNAKLEPGRTEKNNNKSMIKFRKPTKNYKF